MDTPRHRAQMNLLIESISDAWRERRDFYVGGDMFVYFSELQSRGQDFRGPDFFIVLDTDGDRIRKSWVAWQEGGRLPDIVIELLSESTREMDHGEKKRIYERIWRTRFYVLYDPDTHALEGFELVRGEYVPISADARGDLSIASVGLALGVREGTYQRGGGSWLRWIDESGVVLPSVAERASAAEARACEAEARIAELEARLRAIG